MKKNLIIILSALTLGALLTAFIFLKINLKLKNTEKMITVFQVGVFKNEINALSEAKKYNGIVHKDNQYYRVYIAAYQNEEIINKMKNYYNANNTSYYLRKVKANEDYIKTLEKYEKLLQNSDDITIYPNLNRLIVSKLGEYL